MTSEIYVLNVLTVSLPFKMCVDIVRFGFTSTCKQNFRLLKMENAVLAEDFQ